jgi:dTDP-4-dehydrorhamnose reductase
MLTGANGQVGWELSRSLMPLGEVIAFDRARCDLSRPETIPGIVQEINPDVIINAAAYTAVDKAEEEESLATIINGTAVGVLAEEAYRRKVKLIHYSTDYVFDGSKATPYSEDDIPNPLSAYGRSKLAGEQAMLEIGGDFLIFRTTWVYAARGNNFLKTILRLANEREELNIVDDQYGAPTWARNIADASALVLMKWQMNNKERNRERKSGIYNLTASEATTWFGFTQEIMQKAVSLNLIASETLPAVRPIPATDYPLPAPRPQNSKLELYKINKDFELKMPKWQDALLNCLKDML